MSHKSFVPNNIFKQICFKRLFMVLVINKEQFMMPLSLRHKSHDVWGAGATLACTQQKKFEKLSLSSEPWQGF
jgi:hypothetical protein